MDSCSFLIYYLVCFIQKLLQTGCYIIWHMHHFFAKSSSCVPLLQNMSIFHNKYHICILDR